MTQVEMQPNQSEDALPLEQDMVELDAGTSKSFEQYRNMCDMYSGFMRVGIDDPYIFDRVVKEAGEESSRLPISATNETLGFPFNEEVVAAQQQIAILPEGLLDEMGVQKEGIIVTKQTLLSGELAEELVMRPLPGSAAKITQELVQGLPEGEELIGNGIPEYTVLSEYDTADCHDLKASPAVDVILEGGHIITTSQEKIREKLPELIKLHESVFTEQAAQMGYYGGLHEEGLREVINNENFISVAGFDGQTGEAIMFAVFSPDVPDTSTLPWANPSAFSQILNDDASNKALAVPLVITSKAKGYGMFAKTVALAGQETLYRTQADTVYVFCESSAASIIYTPKVINRALSKIGFQRRETIIEATYLSQQQAQS